METKRNRYWPPQLVYIDLPEYVDKALNPDGYNSLLKQLRAEVDVVIKSSVQVVRIHLEPRYEIGLIRHYKGFLRGFAYVYFQDVRVARLVQGLNVDGSPRCERVLTRGWKPAPLSPRLKEYQEMTPDDFYAMQSDPNRKMSWADVDELEQRLIGAISHPVETRPLPPLVALGTRTVTAGYVNSPKSGFVAHTLHTIVPDVPALANQLRLHHQAGRRGVSRSASESQLPPSPNPLEEVQKWFRFLFASFSTANSPQYPEIRIRHDPDKERSGSVYISYDEGTHDAEVALAVRPHVEMGNILLWLRHAKSTR